MAQGLFGTSTPEAQLQQTRLQPTGAVSSPTVRAQQVQTGGNLRALTEALGGLNSSLINMAQVQDKIGDDPKSKANQEWLAKAQMMDQTELVALAASGEADGHRVREDALNSLLGERAYSDFVPSMETYFNTEFDRNTGDVAEEYDSQRERYAAALPNDIARANFYRLTETHRARIVGTVTDERIATTKQQINTTIVDSWYTQLTEAAKNGPLDPETVASSIFSSSKANEAFYGLSGTEQNATVFALASRLAADGKVAEAEALLDTARTAPDGSALPSLNQIPEYAVKGKSLIEAAKTAQSKAANEGSSQRRVDVYRKIQDGTLTLDDLTGDVEAGLFTEAQAASFVNQADNVRNTAKTKLTLAGQAERAESAAVTEAAELMTQPGGVNKIQDVIVPTKTGGTKTLTRAALIEQVRTAKEAEWAAAEQNLMDTKGLSAEEAKAVISDVRQGWYVSQFVENKEWERSFSSLPSMVTPLALEKNPSLGKRASATAELYMSLRAKSPAYAATLVGKGSEDFLETYALAREIDGLPPEEALSVAAGFTAMTPMEKVKTELPKTDKDKLVRKVIKATNEGLDGADVQFVGASRQIIEAQIDRMAAQGIPEDQIQSRLSDWVSERTITVNGVLVPVQKGVTGDFPMLVQRHLDKVFAQKGSVLGLDSANDLSIAPAQGENYWVVIDKRTGMPIGSMDLTQNALSIAKGEHDAEVEAETQANIAAKEADAAERRKAFDDRVGWYDARIRYWEGRGRLGKMFAEGAEAEKQDYINKNNPEWVQQQRDKEDADQRAMARRNAIDLGFPDPFPEDGPLD